MQHPIGRIALNSGTILALARRAAIGVALLVALLILATAGWIAYTQVTRALRETHSPEQLAAGKGYWLAVEGVGLFVQEWGLPCDLILLLTHGTGAWNGNWFGLPDALASAGWRVVAVDLPPFDMSRLVGAVDYSRAAQAIRLLALIDSLGVPVTLLGHSFGTGPALEAATRGGSRLRQLVLVDPALGLGPW